MKNIFFMLFFFFLSFQNYCQNKDSILLVGYEFFEDIYANYELVNERIVSSKFVNDTLHVKVATKAIPCLKFEPSIKVNIDTLQLLFNEKKVRCECECSGYFVYELLYKITGLDKSKEYAFTLNGRNIKYSVSKNIGRYYGSRIVPFDYEYDYESIFSYRDIDIPPLINGTNDFKEFQVYISKTLFESENASRIIRKTGIQGRVFVDCIFYKNRKIDAKIKKGLHPIVDEEIIKILNELDFTPAQLNKKNVSLQSTIPVLIKLP